MHLIGSVRRNLIKEDVPAQRDTVVLGVVRRFFHLTFWMKLQLLPPTSKGWGMGNVTGVCPSTGGRGGEGGVPQGSYPSLSQVRTGGMPR